MSGKTAFDPRTAARRHGEGVPRRAAAVLLAGAAWVAGIPRAQAQGYDAVPPTLRNEDEIRRELSADLPDRPLPSVPAIGIDLTFRVLADGTPDTTTVRVDRGLNSALAARAVAIARKMRFTPARISGMPAAVWYHHMLVFRYDQPGDGVDEGGGTYDTYDLSAVEVQPRLQNGGWAAREIARRYPPAQLKAGTPGDVVVRFRVNAEGGVDSATVAAEMSTDTAFEAPAMAIIRHMRFLPARVRSVPVRVWVTIPIHFDFADDTPADSTANTRPPAPAAAHPVPAAAPSSPAARRVRRSAGQDNAARRESAP